MSIDPFEAVDARAPFHVVIPYKLHYFLETKSYMELDDEVVDLVVVFAVLSVGCIGAVLLALQIYLHVCRVPHRMAAIYERIKQRTRGKQHRNQQQLRLAKRRAMTVHTMGGGRYDSAKKKADIERKKSAPSMLAMYRDPSVTAQNESSTSNNAHLPIDADALPSNPNFQRDRCTSEYQEAAGNGSKQSIDAQPISSFDLPPYPPPITVRHNSF
jgi:hypothetical protein